MIGGPGRIGISCPVFSSRLEAGSSVGRWYRRPKRLNLRPLVREPSCEFVFDASTVSTEELRELQACFCRVVAPERLSLEAECSPHHEKIFVVARELGNSRPNARLCEGWRGVIIVPTSQDDRKSALSTFFLKQSRYKISDRRWGAQYRGVIPPFLLDLTSRPALFTPSDLLAELTAENR